MSRNCYTGKTQLRQKVCSPLYSCALNLLLEEIRS